MLVPAVAVLAPSAGAAGTALPESGPLSQAFVEALHDPLVAIGLGRVPSPVEVQVGAAVETAAARMVGPSSYDLRDEGAPDRREGPGSLRHLLGVRRRRRPGVQAPPRRDARLQRGQPGRPQRLRLLTVLALLLRRLRLHGRRLLRPLGRPGGGGRRPVRHVDRAHGQHRAEARAGRRHASGPHVVERQRPHQATRARERGAQRRHVLGESAFGEFEDATSAIQAAYYLGADGRTTAWTWSAGTTRTLGATSTDRTAARRAQAPSSCATAGAPPGATGATSGSPTTTGRSPATRALAATAGAPPTRLRRGRRQARDIYQYDDLGVTDHWGYGVPRVWGATRYMAAATQTVSAAGFYTRCHRRPGTRCRPARRSNRSRSAPRAFAGSPATARCRSPHHCR